MVHNKINSVTVLLLVAAFEKYGTDITFCGNKKSWEECVQSVPEMNCYFLYFNTPDNSTHVSKLEYRIHVDARRLTK